MDNNIDIISIQKMIFIYNAILSGWTVKMIDNDRFEFIKNKDNISKEVYLNNYLQKFIKENLTDINKILN
tara:strand:+ start:139 stop:348 length:210 start_codon:yes stop_codon:yes gene_type:complete